MTEPSKIGDYFANLEAVQAVAGGPAPWLSHFLASIGENLAQASTAETVIAVVAYTPGIGLFLTAGGGGDGQDKDTQLALMRLLFEQAVDSLDRGAPDFTAGVTREIDDDGDVTEREMP